MRETTTPPVKRWLTLALTFLLALTAFAQVDIGNKLSVSTRLFIKERNNTPDFSKGAIHRSQSRITADDTVASFAPRQYASPVIIDGRAYASAFIRVSSLSAVNALTSKGVIVRNKFNNGLLTTYIPVDSIEHVARLAMVKRINVATLMHTTSDKARQLTNVDDVLTYSSSARTAGLSNAFDGKGVVVGVIDEGIDFKHKAFQDVSGKSRIKRVYAKTSSDGTAQEYTSPSSFPNTDNSEEDHGTHTSSTAGGSSVIISGSTTTVTNDHANASYGGMAPASDLYLVGTNNLDNTVIADGFKKIVDYADSQNEPVVVSNSWGGSLGPRDGSSDDAEIVNQYFGDDHPNHICLFAASNDGGNNMYVGGTSTKNSPLGTVIAPYQSTRLVGPFADIWTRSSFSGDIECKVMVLSRRGLRSSYNVVKTVTVTPTEEGTYVDLGDYYSDSLFVFKDGLNYNPESRTEILFYALGSISNGQYTGFIRANNSSYRLAIQVYPKDAGSSCNFSMYTIPSYHSFTSVSTSGYNWNTGSDASSVSPQATIENSISVGAYVSKTSVTDYNGRSRSLTYWTGSSTGDIASFSSYQAEGEGTTGEKLPWITAPGASIVAAVNAYHTTSDASNNNISYMDGGGNNYGMYRVNNDTSNPYGNMNGTSMATPVAAGIVALWLQAANKLGKKLTVNDVKTIMKETAITDSYTSGSNASHFGNGKIDALAGIKYILENYQKATPALTATPSALTFSTVANTPATQTFNVTGTDLTGDVTATLADDNKVYSLSATTVTAADASAGKTITVTFAPKTAGTFAGTITLASEGAESVTITLNGTATEQTSAVRYKSAADDTWHYLLPDANGAYNVTDGAYYAFEVTEDVEDATVNYTRRYSNSGVWYPWYTPFDVNVDNDLLSNFDFGRFEGIYVNENGEWRIGVIKLNNGDKVYANVPYVIKAKATGEQTITANGTSLLANATGKSITLWSASSYFTFTGINTRKTTTADDKGWYGMSGGTFSQQNKEGSSLNPLRFYLTLTPRTDNPYDGRTSISSAKPASIEIIDADTATGITKISTLSPSKSDAVYDLQGRRVNKPQHGVYISGGKKVIIK